MNPIYDVVILGCGEAGIFAAYELASHRPELKAVSYTHLGTAAPSRPAGRLPGPPHPAV